MTTHRELERWVNEMAELCRPDRVIWVDGSEKEKEQLEAEAVAAGELVRLDPHHHPGCLYHRTDPNDAVPAESLTYVCTRDKGDAGPTNNWLAPDDAYRRAREILAGSMRGRTMYAVPFSMGPVGSAFSKIGVELTDSIVVVLQMRILTRIGRPVLKALGTTGVFTRCLHSRAGLDPARRLLLNFPEENTIWSVGSGFGRNALLGKKCLGLRLASWLGRQEGWLAEHMLILGVEDPDGHIEYVAAALPNDCGKTTLAMPVLPEGMQRKGYRVWTVGDDIAWLRIDTDGRLWAINPETGIFGVLPGASRAASPHAMAMIHHNTIFTNALLTADGRVWWEGHDDPPPEGGTNWRGQPWSPETRDGAGRPALAAHPSSRFTASIFQCPSVSHRLEHHHGVPISAILFGSRRARLAPLVYQSFNWQHGVYLGTTLASERGADAAGTPGELRHDPMAMLPFLGYHPGDYFAHWLAMGKRMTNPPKIFYVNWFRRDEAGKQLWPGYGENLRVLEWIIHRCLGKVEAQATPLGFVPKPRDIDLNGLELPAGALEKLLAIDRKAWEAEVDEQRRFFAQFGPRLPEEIITEMDALSRRLAGATA